MPEPPGSTRMQHTGRVVTVSVHEAKTHLSRLLQQIAAGEDVIITRLGQPVARLVPIDETRPVFGIDEGRFVVPDDFDDPLDEELLRAFEGRTAGRDFGE